MSSPDESAKKALPDMGSPQKTKSETFNMDTKKTPEKESLSPGKDTSAKPKKVTVSEDAVTEPKKNGDEPKHAAKDISKELSRLNVSDDMKSKRKPVRKVIIKEIENGPFRKFVRAPAQKDKKARHEPQLLVKLTTRMISSLYKQCNPNFKYESSVRPRRTLSKPSKPVSNKGLDNEEANLIMYANDFLHTETGPLRSFRLEEMLGKGTFGQVVKAEDCASKRKVAIKVIKNKPAYHNQAIIEIQILKALNRRYDPHDENHIVRLLDSFTFKNHLCLVFELLSVNLYELIKQNRFRGLSCNLIRTIVSQILRAASVMRSAGIVHCDIKPENILLSSMTSASIKIIDFGSACDRNQTVYSYIQSRFYRSPEVLLGLPYDAQIDMWSIGCVAAELFLGLPLFPGVSAFNQVYRIFDMLGVPTKLLNKSKRTRKYFHINPTTHEYRLKTIQEYAEETKTKPVYPKKYFKASTLDLLVRDYPYRKSISEEDKKEEEKKRELLIDFLQSILMLYPEQRATPGTALYHPFIVGEVITSTPGRSNIVKSANFRRTCGFRVNSEPNGFAKPPPSQPSTIRSQPITMRSQPITMRSTYSAHAGSIPNTTYEHKRYETQSYEGQYEGPRSQSIMIQNRSSVARDMSFTKEMADHTPLQHTPVLRSIAHPHSLTLASTPMGAGTVGSPHSGVYMHNMSPGRGGQQPHLYSSPGHSPVRFGSPGRMRQGIPIPAPNLHGRRSDSYQQNMMLHHSPGSPYSRSWGQHQPQSWNCHRGFGSYIPHPPPQTSQLSSQMEQQGTQYGPRIAGVPNSLPHSQQIHHQGRFSLPGVPPPLSNARYQSRGFHQIEQSSRRRGPHTPSKWGEKKH